MSAFSMVRTFRHVLAAAGLTLAVATCAAWQQAIPEYNDPQQPSTPATSAPAATTPSTPSAPADTGKSRKLASELDVPGASQWTDTGIDLVAGDRLVITAAGNIQTSALQATSPDG